MERNSALTLVERNGYFLAPTRGQKKVPVAMAAANLIQASQVEQIGLPDLLWRRAGLQCDKDRQG
jgi:hypothetical protein